MHCEVHFLIAGSGPQRKAKAGNMYQGSLTMSMTKVGLKESSLPNTFCIHLRHHMTSVIIQISYSMCIFYAKLRNNFQLGWHSIMVVDYDYPLYYSHKRLIQ